MATPDVLLYFPLNFHTEGVIVRTYAPMQATPPTKDCCLSAYVLTSTVGSLDQGLYVMDGRCWRFVLPQPMLSEILISSGTVDVYQGLASPITVATDALVYKNGIRITDRTIVGPFVFCVVTPMIVPEPVPTTDPQLVAVRNISGHRVMKAAVGGTDYASSSVPGDAQLVIGISKGAALAGDLVTIQTEGELTEPSWSWDIERPVFNGVDGLLTQTSASGYSLIVGIPLTPTTILVSVKQPIITI